VTDIDSDSQTAINKTILTPLLTFVSLINGWQLATGNWQLATTTAATADGDIYFALVAERWACRVSLSQLPVASCQLPGHVPFVARSLSLSLLTFVTFVYPCVRAAVVAVAFSTPFFVLLTCKMLNLFCTCQ